MSIFTHKSEHEGIFDPMHVARAYEGEMLVLESADIVTKLSEKSILLFDLALKIEAYDNIVKLSALLPEAHELIDLVAQSYASSLREHTKTTLSISISPIYDELDVLAKMQCRSALDIMRVVLKALVPKDQNDAESLMLSGVFAYDFLDHFEKLPKAQHDFLKLPDFLFYVPLSVIMLDHIHKKTIVYAHASNNSDAQGRLNKAQSYIYNAYASYKPTRIKKALGALDHKSYDVDISDSNFGLLIDTCKEHIKAGDVYQIVPSRTFSRPLTNIFQSYEALRELNPSPYMFYVRTKEWTLFGASPETFIKVDKKGSRVSIRPIAGTRRRGLDHDGVIDEELDAREQASLCLDEKELAEHMMLVDLARNDIASIAKANTRRIRRLLGVDRFSHVMHLVSEVEAVLKPSCDALSAYQASMNMGTLMGAPKVRAAELLRLLEHSKRGFYGGAVGYINKCGDMDTAIIIRSAVVKNNHAYVRAGCGVVYDSDRNFEIRETINKAEAVLKAMERGTSI
jgi:anthranilate synthase component 1